MGFIESAKNWRLWEFRWHFIFAALSLVAIIGVMAGIYIDSTPLIILGVGLLTAALITGLFGVLLYAHKEIDAARDNGEKIDNAVELLKRNYNLLGQISKGVCLSNTAKKIVFRDSEEMELTEAVLGKLHQHDFDATAAMIEAMTQQKEYEPLASRLKQKFDSYRAATEDERINQTVAHIENLCGRYRWAKAADQIDTFIKAFPDSEKALAMPKKLQELKNKRKQQLLAAWDKAVMSKDTNLSLAILKELDTYLTPSEGLALQESASSVFRTKLHNLGVQFALAVTEKQWVGALEAAHQIITDFPNSKMAHEIRGKMDILQERAKQSSSIGAE